MSPTDDKETARFVFTDASVKITVQEVCLDIAIMMYTHVTTFTRYACVHVHV